MDPLYSCQQGIRELSFLEFWSLELGDLKITLYSPLILHRRKIKALKGEKTYTKPESKSFTIPRSWRRSLDAGLQYQREPTKPHTSCPAHSYWHAALLTPPLPMVFKDQHKKATHTRAAKHGRKKQKGEGRWRAEEKVKGWAADTWGKINSATEKKTWEETENLDNR